MNNGLGVRLTPTNSPSVRYPASTRLPTRLNHDELSLSLNRVIGSTTVSPNGFDCQASKRRFAYTAGAAAVIANVDDDLQITQQFFRARPTAPSPNSGSNSFGPGTPTKSLNEQEPRNKTVSSLRDARVGRDSADSPTRGWADSPGSKSYAAKERVKAATAVSFSPDGRYLAVGETGYKPRVLIFAADDDRSSDVPCSIMAEHSYGVQCIAFSPDSQFLASLGNVNDGFLHVWRVGPRGNAMLHSSAKCTSTVRQIVWTGSALIAVGMRYIKVWRLDAPSEPASPRKARPTEFGSPMLIGLSIKSFPGRNVILGDLLESTFTAVVAIDSNTAAVCSDRGDVCILDVANGQQALRKVANIGFPVFSVAYNGEALIIAGERNKIRTIDVAEYTSNPCDLGSGTIPKSPVAKRLENLPYTTAIACIGKLVVTIDSQNGVEILEGFSPTKFEELDTPTHTESVYNQQRESCSSPDSSVPREIGEPLSSTRRLPGHGSPVLGVQAMPISNGLGSNFFTWSSDGVVHFWNLNGVLKDSVHVQLGNGTNLTDSPNELKVVRAFSNLDYFATGDKNGVFRIIERGSEKVVFDAQAHSSEILDIVIFDIDEVTLMCSAGRDRIVQVFERKRGNTVLTQTLDEHVSVVNGLLFTLQEARLLSCSFDRTIVIRDRYIQENDGDITSAFVISKTINLKAAPVAMKLMDGDSSLLVSSTDRSVMIYDMELQKARHTFKASDTENGDPVVLSALGHWQSLHRPSLIAGVSSTDKSIRLYQEDGTLVGRDWGHTEGVTDLAIVCEDDNHEKACIVTVAADGTIFLWAASHDHSTTNNAFDRADALVDQPFSFESRTIKPLRRLLSHSDLAKFRPASENTTPKTSPIASPSPIRSPKLGTRGSRMSVAQAPKLEPAAATITASNRSPTSPASPKAAHSRTNTDSTSCGPRRPSLDLRHRTKSTGNLKSTSSSHHPPTYNTHLHDATSHIVRALRTYRRTLSRSPASAALRLESVREVEKELNLTAKAVAEKAASGAGVGEEVMVRLFDEYSERIVRMLDERVERRMMEKDRAASIEEEGEDSVGRGGEDEKEERRGSV